MPRLLACDRCGMTVAQDAGEQGFYRVTNENEDMEAWFCSMPCLANWSSEDPEVTGEDDTDADDTTG